ncbi:MAG TPA: FHA domain-containing protein, partial [Blastocatellia bacterium]|nr:FHA domain-containing protein [Blastocatellia bacterium]
MPNPRLVFVSVNTGSEVDLSGSVSIGRADDNQVRLSDETVSHYHAIIEERSGSFWLSDLGSTRGTTVNGEPIGSSHHLRDGDLISVGGVSLRYLENGGEASAFGSVNPNQQPTAYRPAAGRSGMPPARPARAAAKKRGFSTGQIVAASTAGLLFLVILSALIYKAFNGGPPTGDPTPTPTPTVGTDPEGQLKLQEIRG